MGICYDKVNASLTDFLCVPYSESLVMKLTHHIMEQSAAADFGRFCARMRKPRAFHKRIESQPV